MSVVTDFTAVGNGVANDSAAIQAANDAGEPVYFPPGTYAANGLTMTVPWIMPPGAKILYNGDTFGECVSCNASGIRTGDLHLDLNGREPRTGLSIVGANNTFGGLTVENAVSTDQTWVVRGILNEGSGNRFGAVSVRNFVNAGNSNDSTPQGFVLSGAATRNSVPSVYGNNVRSLVVDASTGDNAIGEIHAFDCKDNAFYAVGGGRAAVDAVVYEGDDNACGFRHGSNATIGAVHIIRSGSSSVFFGDCADVSIGSILVSAGNSGAILAGNEANAGHIKIGSIKGKLRNAQVFALMLQNGTIDRLSIDEVDVQVTVDSSNTISTRSIARLDAAKGVNIGRMKVDVIIANGYAPTDPFYMQFNKALTYPSRIDQAKFALFQQDGVTTYAGAACYVIGSDGTNAGSLTQSKLRIGEGVLTSLGYLRAYTWGTYVPNQLIAA